MPNTTPVLPDDEAPLDEQTLQAFLSAMSTQMVLVGGQALAFWMNRYGIRPPDVGFISNDGDALGSVRTAKYLAQELQAALLVPDPSRLTSLVAQLRIPVAGTGKVRNIDVLHLLYTTSGLKKSNEFTRRVQANAVTVQLSKDTTIRIMHPLDVFESRVHNAVGLLSDKGPHVVTQAEWGIQVGRAAVLKMATDLEGQRCGAAVQRVFRLWKSSVGQRLWHDHQLCVLDAIDEAALLAMRPELRRQLEAVAEARAAICTSVEQPGERSRPA